MNEKVLRVFINDLKAYLFNFRFWLIDAGLIFISAALIALSWPAGREWNFSRPITGDVFFYGLLVLAAVTNLNIKNNILTFSQVLTIREWKSKLECKSWPIILGVCISAVVQTLILIVSTVPVGIFAYLSGAVTLNKLYSSMFSIWILGIILGWIGIYLQNKFTKYLKSAGALVLLVFLVSLLLHSNSLGFKLNWMFIFGYLILAVIGLADLKFDFRSLLFGE
ncbi:MAG: hypothetical protein GX994_05715 [Firmicutes bacterium]|nr:hypothetical protein [Bacillota bacterium]